MDFIAKGDFVYRHAEVPVFCRSQGSFLFDTNNLCYLDAEAANGTASLGFDHSILLEAVQNISAIPASPSFCETDIRKKYSTRIAQKINNIVGQDGKVAFELGGAQGVELAIKIAKKYNPKTQLVVLQGGYHGRSIFTSQLSASHRYRQLMGDWRLPITRLPYPDFEQNGTYTNKDDWRKSIVSQVKQITELEVGGVVTSKGDSDICALIIEPILNAGGIVIPDKEYLEEVVKIFKKLGALIIVDEVFCGFYRTGPFMGFQHFNFKPDIIVTSKAITNGLLPLSCVWARNPILSTDNFPPGTHSSTYTNNILALSVADTVLNRYESWPEIDKDICKIEKSLKKIIDKLSKSRLISSGHAIGAMARLLFNSNIAGAVDDLGIDICKENPINGVHGIILASTGLSPNVLAINPPLTISNNELNLLDALLEKTIKKAEKTFK